ncbi:MAG TPA: DnaJ domain-containing protein [Byssovorax sp.]
MKRHTILATVPCDVRRLELNSAQVFVLSLVDGHMTLSEIADVAGMTLAQLFPHADRLYEAGAVRVVGDARAARPVASSSAEPPPEPTTTKAAARATVAPARRQTKAPEARKTVAPAARHTKAPEARKTVAPAARHTKAPEARKTVAPARRASTKTSAARSVAPPRSRRPSSARVDTPPPSVGAPPSKRASRASSTSNASPRTGRSQHKLQAASPAAPAPAALDAAIIARILELDRAIARGIDHYALLGLERVVEKRGVKRAYFALAAQFHPDRYYGKALGEAQAPIQRVFTRLTEAHDTLVDRARRAVYDASLPPPSASAREPPLHPAPSSGPVDGAPPSQGVTWPPSSGGAAISAPSSGPVDSSGQPVVRFLSRRPVRRPSRKLRAVPGWKPIAALRPQAPPVSSPISAPSEEALRRVHREEKQREVARHVAGFLAVADAAMGRNDVVTAAAHYRLALQNSDDPEIRAKLVAIEAAAKDQVYEASLAGARSAEKNERWDEASRGYARVNAIRFEAWTAERAASLAVRAGPGTVDLRASLKLAEQAVLAEPKNAGYHVTLGELCLELGLVMRAAGEAQRALDLAARDPRATALAAAAKKRS